jgi:hypothetical protein
VVTRDVSDFAVVGGIPARVIKMRFSGELAERVLASRWWERPISELKDFLSDMQVPLDGMHPLVNPHPRIQRR